MKAREAAFEECLYFCKWISLLPDSYESRGSVQDNPLILADFQT